MFKDLYNGAASKISTQDAYLRVMKKVDAAPKKNKYSFAKIATLAACFILTFSMISLYDDFEKERTGDTEIVTPVPVATNEPEISVAEETASPVTVSTVKPQKTPKAVKPEVTPESVSSSKIVKNQGLPEGSMTATARLYVPGEIYTAEKYSEYLGKNIEEAVVLPESYKNESPKEQELCLEEGENFNDEWTYYFTDNESSVFIHTTKNTNRHQSFLNNDAFEKSNISGQAAVVFEEDTQKIAYFTDDSIGYTVTGMDVSDEVFENVIFSLVK